MKNNARPARQADYLLEQIGSEYQLRNRNTDSAIYINETAALLWELCDGRSSVGEIKGLLRESYPDAAPAIDGEVDRVLTMLAEHDAIGAG